MSIKDKIAQRLADLRGCPKEKHGTLIEAKAAELVLRDLTLAAEIANDVAKTASFDVVQEPGMEDVLAIHQLYQAYLGPAYQVLLSTGEIPPPPVPTTFSSVNSKEDLVS
jgi:hypothetical protein